MIFLSQVSKISTSICIGHYALIIRIIACLYFIVQPVAFANVSNDALSAKQNTSELISIPTLMTTDLNKQSECNCKNGTCVTNENKTVCVCDPGFGKIGETTCKACECGTGFGCIFNVGIFTTSKKCLCTEGFLEKNGICKECNCGVKGVCEFTSNGTKICRCHSGYVEINNRCEDINECQLSGVCPSHTRCINTPGSFECSCEEGYEEKSNISNPKFEGCQDIDECLDNKTCPFSSTLCVNLPGSYKCVCTNGYQAINLQSDPRYTRCRANNASWHHANIVLMVLLAASLVTLLGVMLIKRRRSILMSRNVNAYESL